MCYSISGVVRQTDTSIVVLAGIVVYVVVVWHLVGGGLTSNCRAEPSRSPTGGWPLGAGPQSVLLCRLMNLGCAALAGLTHTQTDICCFRNYSIRIYYWCHVVVVWHWLGGGLTPNSRAEPSTKPIAVGS